MKKTPWKKIWLAGLIATSCVGFGRLNMLAQNDDTPATQPEVTAGSITNASSDDSTNQLSTPAGHKRDFRRSFDELKSGDRRGANVSFGSDVELKTNQTAEAVVAIGGSAIARGNVREAVVAIGGDVNIDHAEVGEAAVAVLGNVRVGPGSIVHGDAVSVGGKVEVADGATVEGKIQEVDFGPFGLREFDWLKQYLVQCVLKLRPLALRAEIGWAWGVAGVFFIIYLFVAVVAARPVEICLSELTRRPATTFLMGLLSKLIFPLVFLILAATGIGLVVIPFLLAALFFGALIGKVALLEYLGQSLGRTFGMGPAIKPVLAFLMGIIMVTLLYLVPVLGLITFAVTGLWGLGAVVMAAFGSLRRETPERPPSPPPPTLPSPTMPASAAAFATGAPSASAPEPGAAPVASSAEAGLPPMPTAVPPASASVAISEALTFPRAHFWERVGAAFLDVILVSILGGIVGSPPLGFLVALAYFTGMWTWKGTTVGGIVLNLKVVRLDDKPVTFAVALVRGLASAFSVIVLFLGFLWMIWDRDKQTWHDKIAGTVVIRLPRGLPLVCL